jgi:capsular exopolysaccharide synthesis family protein
LNLLTTISKNYKIFLINLAIFVFLGIIFTIFEKTWKIYISEIRIFSEPIQTEIKNLLPYLYSYSSDEQNNQILIADIISRDLIEGFIKKYNYNFKIVSKEPKNLVIYDIIVNVPIEPQKIYKIKTNENGDIFIKSSLNGYVELQGLNLYDAYHNFLSNMKITTYSLDEIIGNKKQKNIMGIGESQLKIISVSLYSSEPFVNEVAKKFKDFLIEYNINKKMKKFKNSKDFINRQIENYLLELDNLNYKIRQIQMMNNLSLDDSKNPILNELFEIKKKQTSLVFEIQSLNDWLKNPYDENEIITSDPVIQKAITNLLIFKDTLNILLVKFGNSSYEYISVYNAYKKLREDLKQKITERIKNLQSQLNLLRKNELKLKSELSSTFETEKEAISLVSRKKAIEDIITILSQRMEEIKIQEAEIVPDFKILEFTEKPYIEIKGRNWARNLIFSVIFSLFLSIVLIIIQNYTSDVIKDLDNLAKFGIIKAYIIPEISDENYLPLTILKNRDYKKIMEGHMYLESFRIVVLENSLNNLKLFGITSSIQGEGKSYISLNLASTIAMMNKKVVILDCDLRKGDITEITGNSKNLGLSDILTTNSENFVYHYLENLFVVPRGLTFIDPIAVFSNSKFDEFLKFLKDKFDVIILDLPPILRTAETKIVVDKLENIVFVLKMNYTPVDSLKESILRLQKEKIKVYILNGFDLNSNYGYRQKYYYKVR